MEDTAKSEICDVCGVSEICDVCGASEWRVLKIELKDDPDIVFYSENKCFKCGFIKQQTTKVSNGKEIKTSKRCFSNN